LKTHRTIIALHHGGQSHPGAADQLDGRGVGVHFTYPADDATGKDHRGTHGDPIVAAFANCEALPPSREIASHHPGVFKTMFRVGGYPQQILQSFDIVMQFGVLLHRQIVGRIDTGQIATRFDQFQFGVRAQRPELLQITNGRRADTDRRLQFKEGGPQKRLDGNGNNQPCRHDNG
jgi:hypothetical protein